MNVLNKIAEYPLFEGPLKIESINVLTGANYFSGGPVIRFRLNLGKYNEVFTNDIPGFYEKLKTAIPSLYEHHCSVGEPGGFFLRVQEGTLLGHVMEHVSLELQALAGMDVGFGKTRITKKESVYNVLFRFLDETAGIYAGKAAFNFVNCLLTNKHFVIDEVIKKLVFIREKNLLGPSTQAIVNEAENRKIPYFRLDKYNQVQLGTGKYRKIIRATTTEDTSLIAVETADDKYMTTSILKEAGIPVPKRIITDNLEKTLEFYNTIQKEIVIKPAEGYQGKRVSIQLDNEIKIENAFNFAKEFGDEIIAQEYIPGNLYRLIVIDFKFVAAVQLIPAFITGDGINTIRVLIRNLNNEPGREVGDKGILSKVKIDEDTRKILQLNDLLLNDILEKGKKIFLKNSGNMRLGGTSHDVTQLVNPFNRFIAERTSKTLNLNVAGVDIISKDIGLPLTENNGKVIEVNAAPDFRMHFNPTVGIKRQVQKQFVNMLFPQEAKVRVPIFSVTGSKGKSLVVNYIDNCLKKLNSKNGVVSKNGLFVSGICLKKEDMNNSENQLIILKDPTIDCAIFETPVEMILNTGIGYEYADISIVLNLYDDKEDYYEYDHMRDIDDVAYAKSVVAEEVYDDGFTILNADDTFVFEMSDRLYSKLVLFSKNKENDNIKKHIQKGGLAIILDNSEIFIVKKGSNKKLININEIPVTKEIKENYVTDSILASAAALHVFGVDDKNIIETLT
ncbi:MAG: ATP-grasp domain-containing protein [Bacteroidales bacterium]|nr:ATP-grasp domain-containing protein [Bacteroidales bacterium]